MKIENNSNKAKWIHYKINGIPKKRFLNAHTSYDENEIDDFNQLNLNSRDETLYRIEERMGRKAIQKYTISVYDKEIGTSWENYQVIVGRVRK